MSTAAAEGPNALSDIGDALAEAGAASLTGERGRLAEGLLRAALSKWEDPQARPQLLGAFSAVFADDQGAAQMRDFMSRQIFQQLAASLDDGQPPKDFEEVARALGVPPMNINAAQAQVWGVAVLRYVVKLEPIASASVDDVVALVSPTIQRYLTG
ncbi:MULTISPECIES: hypothetical protein [unclassified Streptomyces]|uniref:TetR/AcrR family transcriptional regulator n=1 Tax=unclassified Streptomyces TaxID=2593676 RepID=UPI0022855260|nr:hypothetical protein [Streptomyces sp. Je 1-369]WAL93131.1 hypothetical protein NOO62_00630 [Streptomyces sp. Je 1-369]WAL99849.1 hypothetical protein NOO62_38495 [Streptomyces sp. Je 1-369]